MSEHDDDWVLVLTHQAKGQGTLLSNKSTAFE